MNERAKQLIELLELTPHPEGGHYREIYRSPLEVTQSGRETPRSAMTSIYFLLCVGEISRWHKVDADESWHFYEGAPLQLLDWRREEDALTTVALGSVAERARPVYTIAAGHWQAATPLGEYSLVGCTVSPAFEFAGFEMMASNASASEMMRNKHSDLAKLI